MQYIKYNLIRHYRYINEIINNIRCNYKYLYIYIIAILYTYTYKLNSTNFKIYIWINLLTVTNYD